MAIVNALRFDDYSGAIISDEESWRLRRRRTVFCDNVHSLVTPEISDAFHIEAVYGGIGTPAIHYETVTKTQQKLLDIFKHRNDPEIKKQLYKTIGDISKITLENLQKTIRRRTDDRLRFLYGFTSEDLNRGYFVAGGDPDVSTQTRLGRESQGEKIDIKQENVKSKALEISTLKDKSETARFEVENHACLIGYDKKHGFTAYCLKGEISVSSFVSGGFESLGTGKYGGGQAFAEFLNKKFLAERTKGFNRIEGMIELIYSAIQCSLYFSQVGGYFAIAYIDGRGKDHASRYKEIIHHRAKLASEIVHSYKAGYLPRNITYQLINDLVYEDAKEDTIEGRFFKAVKDRKKLEYFLRAYKLDPLRRE
ncbi:MAG: hypothetical protein V1709_01575 [Planctomycetota bacterium]